MKTSIKTLFATGLIALAISTSTTYANEKPTVKTTTAATVNIASIKRIIVSGNVQVTITQNPKAKVLYTNNGNADVAVKMNGGSLYISAKNNAADANITVYVADIYRIEASNEAQIFTTNLTLPYLQVYLKDYAYLYLNAQVGDLYTDIKNTSVLTLKGSTDKYNIDMDGSSRIALSSFKSKKTEMKNGNAYISSRS